MYEQTVAQKGSQECLERVSAISQTVSVTGCRKQIHTSHGARVLFKQRVCRGHRTVPGGGVTLPAPQAQICFPIPLPSPHLPSPLPAHLPLG